MSDSLIHTLVTSKQFVENQVFIAESISSPLVSQVTAQGAIFNLFLEFFEIILRPRICTHTHQICSEFSYFIHQKL